MHAVKVPVVRRWCYYIYFEHVQPNATFIHCELRTKWSKQVKRELQDGWHLLRLCHRGPIHALHDPSDHKHKKFLEMFGFKYQRDLSEKTHVWVWEDNDG